MNMYIRSLAGGLFTWAEFNSPSNHQADSTVNATCSGPCHPFVLFRPISFSGIPMTCGQSKDQASKMVTMGREKWKIRPCAYTEYR